MPILDAAAPEYNRFDVLVIRRINHQKPTICEQVLLPTQVYFIRFDLLISKKS